MITAAEFHPHHCNLFVYSSSKGTLRLCDMREAALCDRHSKCESHPRRLGGSVLLCAAAGLTGPLLTPASVPLAPPPVFEEPEDPSARSFFSEIISSVSDVKFSHSGRYLLTRDYLTAKVWDLNMESKPLETYQVCVQPACRSPSLVVVIQRCSAAQTSPHLGETWGSVRVAVSCACSGFNRQRLDSFFSGSDLCLFT